MIRTSSVSESYLFDVFSLVWLLLLQLRCHNLVGLASNLNGLVFKWQSNKTTQIMIFGEDVIFEISSTMKTAFIFKGKKHAPEHQNIIYVFFNDLAL